MNIVLYLVSTYDWSNTFVLNRFAPKPGVCHYNEDIMLKVKGTLKGDKSRKILPEDVQVEITFVWLKKHFPRPLSEEKFSYSVPMNLGIQGGTTVVGNKKTISVSNQTKMESISSKSRYKW